MNKIQENSIKLKVSIFVIEWQIRRNTDTRFSIFCFIFIFKLEYTLLHAREPLAL